MGEKGKKQALCPGNDRHISSLIPHQNGRKRQKTSTFSGNDRHISMSTEGKASFKIEQAHTYIYRSMSTEHPVLGGGSYADIDRSNLNCPSKICAFYSTHPKKRLVSFPFSPPICDDLSQDPYRYIDMGPVKPPLKSIHSPETSKKRLVSFPVSLFGDAQRDRFLPAKYIPDYVLLSGKPGSLLITGGVDNVFEKKGAEGFDQKRPPLV